MSKSKLFPMIWRMIVLRARLKLRPARRRMVVAIRNLIALDEDAIRDEAIDGLQRDMEGASKLLAQALGALNEINERLEYHEEGIPRMRTLREQFDQGKRVEKKVKELAVEARVQTTEDQRERHALGLLQ